MPHISTAHCEIFAIECIIPQNLREGLFHVMLLTFTFLPSNHFPFPIYQKKKFFFGMAMNLLIAIITFWMLMKLSKASWMEALPPFVDFFPGNKCERRQNARFILSSVSIILKKISLDWWYMFIIFSCTIWLGLHCIHRLKKKYLWRLLMLKSINEKINKNRWNHNGTVKITPSPLPMYIWVYYLFLIQT